VDGHGAQQGPALKAKQKPTPADAPDVALVGYGYWGRNLARNLHQLGALRVVCDRRLPALEEVRAAYPGVRTIGRAAAVLADEGVQAVVVAAPAAQHYRLAKAALLAGKDVFVEKPLALRLDEARELVALARQRRRILMVGHLLEYHPAIRKLKQLVDAGELGELHHIYSNRLNLGKVRREENILWSFAPHDVSVILLLLGRMPTAAATTGQHYLQHQIADVTMTWLTFPGRTRAHIFVSWLHPYKEQRLIVVGSRRMAVFDDVATEGKLKLYDQGIEWKQGAAPVIRRTAEATLFFAPDEPLREELAHFLECVRERRRPQTDGRNGLRVLRVLDACQRSLASGGRPVKV
jgi:UDP-2-acetamido-3-amino-2,3-dideoxy-glucuronate N-acetyltransferase